VAEQHKKAAEKKRLTFWGPEKPQKNRAGLKKQRRVKLIPNPMPAGQRAGGGMRAKESFNKSFILNGLS